MRPEQARQVEMIVTAAVALVGVGVSMLLMRSMDPTKPSKASVAQRKRLEKAMGRKLPALDQYEESLVSDVIFPDRVRTRFDDIGGLGNVKSKLRSLVITPLRRPELYVGSSLLRQPKGILLYGPPGTGKTMLAQAIAKESGARFINVSVSSLQSKWFGDAAKLVRAVFTLSWKFAPSIIFIDEVDSFLGKRRAGEHEANTQMKTEFMALWDGMITDASKPVVVLAATNRPEELDDAIKRRLPRRFEVGLPEEESRAHILHLHVGAAAADPASDVDIRQVAKRTPGYSGSDLWDLCARAARAPIEELEAREQHLLDAGADPKDAEAQSSMPRALLMADFEEAIREFEVERRIEPTEATAAVLGGRGADGAALYEQEVLRALAGSDRDMLKHILGALMEQFPDARRNGSGA